MYNYRCEWKNAPEYNAWIRMNRQYAPSIFPEWRWYKKCPEANQNNFTNFRKFMGPKPDNFVLIRFDKKQPFGPGNTAWGSHEMNAKFRGPFRKFSYSRDNELIAELERRGYDTSVLAKSST